MSETRVQPAQTPDLEPGPRSGLPLSVLGSSLLRIAALIAGLALTLLSVLIRYSTGAITVGNWLVTFKFWQPFPERWVRVPVALALVVLVFGFLALLLNRQVRQALANLRSNPRNQAWAIAMLAVLVLTMVPLDRAAVTPSTEQQIAVYLFFASAGALLLLCAIGSWLEVISRPLDAVYQYLLRLPRTAFLIGCAAFVFVFANVISYFIFHHMPHIHDTIAQVFQARLFAQGRLYAPSPAYPEFFDVMHIISNGRWYSQYPPGHPLLLMLGLFIHAPWLINPLLGALTVVVIYYFGLEVYDEPTARLATLLATLSPFLLFMSSEFMNHSSALLFVALFLLCYARSRPGASHVMVNALLAGLAMGFVILIRPMTALFIVVPFVLEAAWELYRNPGANLRRYAWMFAGGAVMTAVLLAYNYATNGNALEFGYTVLYGKGHGLGFGHSGWGDIYTPVGAIVGTSIELNGLNRFLFEFPIPSLLFLLVLFAAVTRERWDFLLGGTVVCLVAGYFFYWWHSLLFGPRWEFEALPALVLLSARGLKAIPRFIQENLALLAPVERIHARLRALLLLCALTALGVGLPTLIQDYQREFGVLHTTARTIKKANLHHALVFSRKYDETFLENSPAFGGRTPGADSFTRIDGDVIYARDIGTMNPLLTRLYPGRSYWYGHRDTLRELKDLDFDHSGLKEGLDSVAQRLRRMDLSEYRTLIWPALEAKDLLDPADLPSGLRITDPRELSRLTVDRSNDFRQYLPALAVGVIGDKSEALLIFSLLDGQDNFIVGDYRFTHIATTVNGRVVIYDVRLVDDETPPPAVPDSVEE